MSALGYRVCSDGHDSSSALSDPLATYIQLLMAHLACGTLAIAAALATSLAVAHAAPLAAQASPRLVAGVTARVDSPDAGRVTGTVIAVSRDSLVLQRVRIQDTDPLRQERLALADLRRVDVRMGSYSRVWSAALWLGAGAAVGLLATDGLAHVGGRGVGERGRLRQVIAVPTAVAATVIGFARPRERWVRVSAGP